MSLVVALIHFFSSSLVACFSGHKMLLCIDKSTPVAVRFACRMDEFYRFFDIDGLQCVHFAYIQSEKNHFFDFKYNYHSCSAYFCGYSQKVYHVFNLAFQYLWPFFSFFFIVFVTAFFLSVDHKNIKSPLSLYSVLSLKWLDLYLSTFFYSYHHAKYMISNFPRSNENIKQKSHLFSIGFRRNSTTKKKALNIPTHHSIDSCLMCEMSKNCTVALQIQIAKMPPHFIINS